MPLLWLSASGRVCTSDSRLVKFSVSAVKAHPTLRCGEARTYDQASGIRCGKSPSGSGCNVCGVAVWIGAPDRTVVRVLEGAAMAEHGRQCPPENLKVKAERPVANVV